MGNVAATADRQALSSTAEDAIKHVLARPTGGARMRFLDEDGPIDIVQAVVVWPGEHPLLTDVCALFEHFGLRVASQHPLTATAAPTNDAIRVDANQLRASVVGRQCRRRGRQPRADAARTRRICVGGVRA
jgi:hypothetical protein